MQKSSQNFLIIDQDSQQVELLISFLAPYFIESSIYCLNDQKTDLVQYIGNHNISFACLPFSQTDNNLLNLIEKLRSEHPETIIITSIPEGNRDILQQCLNAGAHFILNLPYKKDETQLILERAIHYQSLLQLSKPQQQNLRTSDGFCGIVGKSDSMLELFTVMEKISNHDQGTVLVQGESGTGKELVAKAIHRLSQRSKQNFVPVNCAAIPEDLLESELFGYVKGAFTGAVQSKQGRLSYAHEGTLFLDEIGDMKPGLQGKLLRVLQESEFEPIGAVKTQKVDVRIIAATNCNLQKAVQEGYFREDLYYRLHVVPIHIPPLRERTEDIPTLAEKFILINKRGDNKGIRGFTQDALSVLKQHTWPGNVRELENLIQRLSILNPGETITVAKLPPNFHALDPDSTKDPNDEDHSLTQQEDGDFYSQVSEFEDRLILQALIKANGNKKLAAEFLKIKRTTLLEKIKRKNLDQVEISKK